MSQKIPAAFDLTNTGIELQQTPRLYGRFQLTWPGYFLQALKALAAGELSGGAELLSISSRRLYPRALAATGRGTRLDLSGVPGDGQVGDGGVLGLAGTVGNPWR